MKKLAFLAALGFILTSNVFAQRVDRDNNRNTAYMHERNSRPYRASPEEIAHRKSEELDRRFRLSGSQQRKVEALALRTEREKQDLERRDRMRGMPEYKYRKEMQRIQNDWEKGLRSILTRKQYDSYRDRWN
ncbi:hypothetical protein QNI16_32060 [Cytophagaceae bacterium YF14B1]|uniref:DUF4890 domain-containing protein n=1 Tax=Xanthocytophaga flava TaxID=3048013 RepID=A0AAE3UC72_9BACT|nr:hypothetical protein [Xanthocytophaga flavus]MDJ1485178.1 hypothetical protein [Xanthocytophaga flavus]